MYHSGNPRPRWQRLRERAHHYRRHAATTWASLPSVRRRVLAAALGLVLASLLLTSTVSAALYAGYAPLPRSFAPSNTPTRTAAPTSQVAQGGHGARATPTRTPVYGPPTHPTATAHATAAPPSRGAINSPGAIASPHRGSVPPSKQTHIHSSNVVYSAGDVLAASGSGQVLHYDASGNLLDTLDTTTGSTYTTGMCIAANGDLYVTDFSGGAVSQFDNAGNLLQANWGSGFNYDPESCTIDNAGHVFVGQADGTREILEFDSAGNLLNTFAPATEDRGTDWVDLSPDQCTIYYTSEGSSVLRYNVCTNTQEADFVTGLAAPCYALRIRTNGEVMVACQDELYRLSPAGDILQIYPTSSYGATDFFAMNLDPDGTSMWTAGESSNGVYRIDIATGNLLSSFTAAVNSDIAGIEVYGEAVAGVPNGPQGTERFGNGNLTELNQCTCKQGDPIDTYSGNFSHTFADLTVPGRGIPLAFSRTYNAGAASVAGPLGYGWTNSYSVSLSIDSTTGDATVAQENGSTVGFAPDGVGGYTAPSRVLASLVKNGDGSYTFTRAQDQTHLTFNASGQLVSETDRDGYATTLAYTGALLSTVTDQAGRTLTFAYDASNRIIKVTDSSGRSVAFTYDGSGNLASATDVSGGVWHFTYDTNHLLLTMTDPRGGITTNVYDTNGRVTSQTDAMGRQTTFAYSGPDSNGNGTTTVTHPNGNVDLEAYIHSVLVSRTTGYGTPQAATSSYTYDPVSLGVRTSTDPDGKVTIQTWDTNGNLLSLTDGLGRTTTYTYNGFNEATSVTDPLGVTTTNTYDARGNLLTTARPLVSTGQVSTTRYAYGDVSHPGDVTAMTDPNGHTWHYAYDANGDRTSTTDPLSEVTTATYDSIGRLLTQVSPDGHVAGANPAAYTTQYAYDAFGDVTQVTDPLGGTTTNQYDATRDLTRTTDPNGHVTVNTYDLDGELTKVTRADGSALTYTYDANGNQTGQSDGLGHTTSYGFDALNRVTSVTDPLGRTTSYGYDPAGNRTFMSDYAGNVTYYGYDTANQLVQITYSDGLTPDVSLYYDADGQRITMIDGTGATFDAYDSLHRLTSETNGAGQTVSYGYDLDGHLTTLLYPSGQQVIRSYDAAGRWRTVTDWLGHTTHLRYDADGNLIEETLADGVNVTRAYDAADRLTSIADTRTGAATPFLSFAYTRDALGLVTSLQPVKPGAGEPANESYAYTALNQVSALNQTGYSYNPGGLLVQRGSATLAYDAADELTSQTQGSATTTYTFDARGNRTQATTGAATTSYGYDQENRLTSFAASGTAVQYGYDGTGLRQSKTVGTTVASFTWDAAEGLPLLLQDGTAQYVTGPGGLPLEQVQGSTVRSYLADQLGSTRALVDATGAVVASYAYDAFGALTASTGSAAAANPFRFAGQYTDAESGLLYLHARYYDPATAQFLTRDPLTAVTQQPYGYASSNPLNFTDPSGKFFGWDNALAGLANGLKGVGTTAFVDLATKGHIDFGDEAIAFGAGFVGGFVGEECGPLAEQCTNAITGSLTELGTEVANHQQVDWGRVAEEGLYATVPGPLSALGIDAGPASDLLDSYFKSVYDPFASQPASISHAQYPQASYGNSGVGYTNYGLCQ